jgi:hypothetical protein
MAVTLEQILLAPDTRPKVADDCFLLVEQQIAEISGVSGAAVRLAYKTVNTFRPGHIRHLVGTMLPDLVVSLEPYWADFSMSGGAGFGDYLAKRGEEVSQSLLSVSDTKATTSSRPVVIRAYHSVRGSARKHIEAALPQVGDLITKYMP